MISDWYIEEETKDLIKELKGQIQHYTDYMKSGIDWRNEYQQTVGRIQALEAVLEFVESKKEI